MFLVVMNHKSASIILQFFVHVCSLFCLVGTNRYFRKVAERMNIQATFVDATDLALVRASMKPNTKVHESKDIVGFKLNQPCCLTLVVNSIQCIIVYYYYYHHHYHHHDYYYSLLLLLLLLFLKPTSTKPQAENIDVLNKVNGCNDVSFGDHGVLEGDRIPPLLKSHGQALEEELCFPQ